MYCVLSEASAPLFLGSLLFTVYEFIAIGSKIILSEWINNTQINCTFKLADNKEMSGECNGALGAFVGVLLVVLIVTVIGWISTCVVLYKRRSSRSGEE